MYRTILVPLDGSAFGEHALSYALSIARRAGARLELAHVHAPLPVQELNAALVAEAENQARRQAQEYVAEAVRRVSAVAPVPVNGSLLEGEIVAALLGHAAAVTADLIVLTTHGRGPLMSFWLGSVASNLVRQASAPVLLVRPQEAAPDLTADHVLRRILIPLDGSSHGEQILGPATTLEALMQAEYRLVRAVPPVLVGGSLALDVRQPGGGPALVDLLETEARTYLEAVGNRLPGSTLVPAMHVARAWPPAAVILADAEAHPTDLIALATHGRGGVARLFLGSVADKVLRGTTKPVLLYRPQEAKR